MCGIVGIAVFAQQATHFLEPLEQATQALKQRGPDNQATYRQGRIGLGHTRLSVIDTAPVAHQPMFDASGNYVIVFNGEIFNYLSLRQELAALGVNFVTQSDTEALLYGYIHWGADLLNRLNGFFAFAVYHLPSQKLFLARDRFGVKPLLYYADAQRFVFASEMKALLAAQIPRQINAAAMQAYFQLNYVPQPYSMLQNVSYLPPGTYMKMNTQTGAFSTHQYYQIPYADTHETAAPYTYEQAQRQLITLLEDAVRLRLVADVPLGAFLSGGIDSSVMVALAAQQTPHLRTFSIGFKDEPLFNETPYAQLVANRYQTNHTEFLLHTDDLYQNLFAALDYIDEPFADSSALAVNILSLFARRHVTVALSGDGADELFAGYRKHAAELRARKWQWASGLFKAALPVLQHLPQSRNTFWGNFFRQVNRFADGVALSPANRYLRWASILTPNMAAALLLNPVAEPAIPAPPVAGTDFNQLLLADMQMVLPSDMLKKVDSMSMAHGLEVRTPFLDYRVVNFAFELPASYKINAQMKKRLVQDTFKHMLPPQLYNRPKQGFEVPMLRWLKTGLYPMLTQNLLHPDFLHQQAIFNPQTIAHLLTRLTGNNPADVPATIWALLVFQYWWKKYFV